MPGQFGHLEGGQEKFDETGLSVVGEEGGLRDPDVPAFAGNDVITRLVRVILFLRNRVGERQGRDAAAGGGGAEEAGAVVAVAVQLGRGRCR